MEIAGNLTFPRSNSFEHGLNNCSGDARKRNDKEEKDNAISCFAQLAKARQGCCFVKQQGFCFFTQYKDRL